MSSLSGLSLKVRRAALRVTSCIAICMIAIGFALVDEAEEKGE